MKSPLTTLCLLLWAAGLLAMLALKGAFDHGPGTDAFSTAQGIWATGGLGYVLIGALGMAFHGDTSKPRTSRQHGNDPARRGTRAISRAR